MRRAADKRRSRLRFYLALAIVAAVWIAFYQGGRWLEKRGEKPEARGDHQQRYDYDALLDYDGKNYRLRKNLTTILIMGVDRPGDRANTSYRNGGQADFLRLVVIDHANQRVNQILSLSKSNITYPVLSCCPTKASKAINSDRAMQGGPRGFIQFPYILYTIIYPNHNL